VTLFGAIVLAHIAAGTLALIAFWVPMLARKGSANHKRWGRIFAYAVYVAATLACSMGLLNLTVENGRHPTLADRAVFDGLFGWMMIYLGLLSQLLVHYGLAAVANRRVPAQNRNVAALASMAVVALFAVICAVQGLQLAQPLMVALAVLGLIAVGTFARAALSPKPAPTAYLAEHVKAMVAGGISAYTAFLSVGLLRIVPEQVFNPLVWALPSVVGVMLIIHHLRMLPGRG
jgi:hypothetical protein